MKKFLLYSISFAALTVVVFSVITYVTDRGLQQSEFGNLKEWRDIFESNINADIIVQGSSRAWVQYDTQILDSVLNANSYNMGMDGSPFDVQYLKYKMYIHQNKAPKVIIQNVDWDLMDKNVPVFQKYQFLPFMSDPVFEAALLKNNFISKSDVYLPFLKYTGEPKAIQVGFSEFFGLQHFATDKHKGFHANEAEWNPHDFYMRKQMGEIGWKMNSELDMMFHEFLSDCKSRNIKVILVFAPCYHEFTKTLSNYNELKLYYARFAKQYNIQFLDYSLDNLSYNTRNFYNATHLNKNGAEAFTIKLSNQLKKIQILKNE